MLQLSSLRSSAVALGLLAVGCTSSVTVTHRYPTGELPALDGYDMRNQSRLVPTRVATSGSYAAVAFERVGESHSMISDRGRLHEYDGSKEVLGLVTSQGRVGGQMKSLRVTPTMVEGETIHGSPFRLPLGKVRRVEIDEQETSYAPAVVLAVLAIGALLALAGSDDDGEE